MTTSTGRTYLLRGQRVTVLTRAVRPSKRNPLPPCPAWLHWIAPPTGAPRNATVRWPDGRTAVRPTRGLRRTGGTP